MALTRGGGGIPASRVCACVIGSGITGLVATQKLQQLGISSVLLEKEAHVGGIWCSPRMYKGVTLQQHRSEFVLPNEPWPAATPEFPALDDVRRYIKAYAEKYSLDELATTNAPVQSARFNPTTRTWLVHAANVPPIEAEWLGVATGSLGEPLSVDPALLAGFDGPVMHSSEFFHATPFLRKHIVLVGLGASSVEIAGDLAQAGIQVTILARAQNRADWVLPRTDASGRPLRLSANGDASISRAERAARARAAVMARLGGKTLADFLPPTLVPQGEPLDGRIIVSETFLDRLRDGTIHVVAGELTGAEGSELAYRVTGGASGSLRNVGAVISCVGFRSSTSTWSKILDPAPAGMDLYQTIFSPRVPQAAFLGVGYGFVAAPAFAELHAEGFVRAVQGKVELPPADEMEGWIADVAQKNPMGSPGALTDNEYFRSVKAFLTGDASPMSMPDDARVAQDASPKSDASPAPAIEPKGKLSEVAQQLLGEKFKVDSEDAVKETYSNWAATYDADSFEALRFDSPKQCTLAALAHWPRTKADAFSGAQEVLDVGCGTGALGWLLQSLSGGAAGILESRLHGFDLTESMLQVCRRNGHYNGSVVQHSATQYPWPYESASMDLVLCNGVLIYVKDSACLDEMVRVLRPGGSAVIMLRRDGYITFADKMAELEEAGEWRLVDVSETRNNFPGGGDSVEYNIYVFRRQEARSASHDHEEADELLSG